MCELVRDKKAVNRQGKSLHQVEKMYITASFTQDLHVLSVSPGIKVQGGCPDWASCTSL